MACINPDGTLTPSAKKVLIELDVPSSTANISQNTGLPVYRIRSSLRELIEAGFVSLNGDKYTITPQGKEALLP